MSYSEEKSKEFHKAAEERDFVLVQVLSFDPEVNLDWQDEEGRTPFYQACSSWMSNEKIVRYLLDFNQRPIDYNLPSSKGDTPFSIACEKGNEEVVNLLLADPRIDQKFSQGKSEVFRRAVKRKFLQLVKVLSLDPEVNLDEQDDKGCTPFYHACLYQSLNEILRYLLDFKQRPIDYNLPSSEGYTPFVLAACVNIQGGDRKRVEMLLADDRIDQNRNDGKSVILLEAARYGNLPWIQKYISDPEVNLDWQDNEGHTLFSCACSCNAEVVRYLLDFNQRPIDYNLPNSKGSTPFVIACENDREDVIEMLLADARIDHNKNEGKSKAFFFAAKYHNLPRIQTYISDPEVNLDWQDHDGCTPFSQLCSDRYYSIEIVRYFLDFNQRPVDYNMPNSLGDTPFLRACERGNEKVVDMLLADERIDLGRPNNEGRTPFNSAYCKEDKTLFERLFADERMEKGKGLLLNLVCQSGDEALVVRLLADERVDVNVGDSKDRTPVWWVVEREKLGILKLLLASEKQIDTGKKDNHWDKRTATELAKYKGQNDAAVLLVWYERDPQAVRAYLRKGFGLPVASPVKTIPQSSSPAPSSPPQLSQDNTVSAPTPTSDAVTLEPETPLPLDSLPTALTNQLKLVIEKEETKAFLAVASINPQIQAMAKEKQSELKPDEFVAWVESAGKLFEEQLGGDVKTITVTEENQGQIKGMIQQLSTSLGEAILTPISDLEKELAKNQVKIQKGSYESHRDTAWGVFGKKKEALKSTIGDVHLEPEDLLVVRLYTMDRGELSVVCYTTVNEGLRNSAITETANGGNDAKKKQEGEKVLTDWRYFISHLTTTISQLKGTLGLHYRGQTFIPLDMAELKPGNVMIWPAFTSCSTNKAIARKFAKGKVMYEIAILTEFGGSIQDYSYYLREDELVIPPFTSFRVDSIAAKHGQFEWYVRITCLGITATPRIESPLASEEEEPKAVEDAFTAVYEGNALYFLYNRNLPAKLGEEKNGQGQSLLFVAAQSQGSEASVKWMLEKNGSDVNVKNDQDGKTALHGAIGLKQTGTAKILLKKGADENIKSKDSKVASEENPEVMNLVKEEIIMEQSREKEEKESPKSSLEEVANLKGEIEKQNKEIERQNKEIERQKREIEKQSKEIGDQSKEIEDLKQNQEMTASGTSSPSKPLADWSTTEVVAWLRNKGQDKLVLIAEEQDIDGLILAALNSVRMDGVAYKNDCLDLGITAGPIQLKLKGLLTILFEAQK